MKRSITLRMAVHFTVVLLLFSSLMPVLAQTSRGAVTGIVADSTGAVISGAAVSLTNTQTGVTRSTVSNGEGAYRFDAVDLGTYSIKIVANNFADLTKTNIQVSANQIAQVDVQLAPSRPAITTDVTAEPGGNLQKEAPVRGGNIE